MTEQVLANTCYHFYYGGCTWFCCGSPYGSQCPTAKSHGSCGTCNNSSHQCAWPWLTNGCNFKGCGASLPQLPCGTQLTVLDECNGLAVTATIADCGPAMSSFCSSQANDCQHYTPRIIDLTPSAFSALASLSQGTLSARVAVPYAC
jgi:hypothetical protein